MCHYHYDPIFFDLSTYYPEPQAIPEGKDVVVHMLSKRFSVDFIPFCQMSTRS